jgi:hypothetical protein
MRRHVFEHLVEGIEAIGHYFKQNQDAIGRLGLTSLQKAVATIHILLYGLPKHVVDEYVRIGESSAHKALHHFYQAIISVFGECYLHSPNIEHVASLL